MAIDSPYLIVLLYRSSFTSSLSCVFSPPLAWVISGIPAPVHVCWVAGSDSGEFRGRGAWAPPPPRPSPNCKAQELSKFPIKMHNSRISKFSWAGRMPRTPKAPYYTGGGSHLRLVDVFNNFLRLNGCRNS